MDKGMTMETILNPERKDGGYPTPIKIRQTETVSVQDVKRGDTVIIENAASVPAYRVVAESGPDQLNKGYWVLSFDPDRDVPGPGRDFNPGNGCTSYGLYDTTTVERVTDLGDWEMSDIARTRSLDILADGRVVWEVARQASKDGQVLVRFAGSDNFDKVPPSSVVLVQGRRMNKHVQGEYEKSMKQRQYR